MSENQPGPSRSITPREGWQNIFEAKDVGEAMFNQGRLYEVSYGGEPIIRLIYNPEDFVLKGSAVITARCILCGLKSRAMDSFEDYPLIGSVDVGTIRMTLTMSTGRIMHHLATQHDQDLGGVDDEDFFNSILDCCSL